MASFVIGAKNNLVKTDKNNTLTGINTFEGNSIFNGGVEGLVITDIENLQTELDDKSTLEELQTETNERENSDITLQGNIDTENQQRIESDLILQTQINTKLAEANSVFKADYTKYIVDGRDNNLQSVVDSITNQGTVVYLSQGSISGSGLVIDKINVAFVAPKSNPPILEIIQTTTTAISAYWLRFSNIQWEGLFNAGSSRSVYTDCDFMENVNILASQTPGYMTFNGCGFTSGKTINVANDFASVIYFINCNFGGCSFSLNQPSNQQVIFSNCAGFVSFPTNAFYAGINTLTSGYTQNTITKSILSAGAGNVGQIYTSGGAGGVDSWTTPSGSGGICLECIMVIPKAQTIITKSLNSITFQNPTTPQSLLQLGSYSVLEGSVFSYQPPLNTKLVIMSFSFKFGYPGTTNGVSSLSFQVRTGTDTTPFNSQSIIPSQSALIVNSGMGHGEYTITLPINIDSSGTNSITNGLLTSWTTPKLFFFAGAKDTSSTNFYIHQKSGYNGTYDNSNFSPPYLKIEAFS